MRKIIALALALCTLAPEGRAQNAITQEGTVLQNSPMMFRGNNRARQGATVNGAPTGQTVTTGDSVVGGRCDYSAPTDSPDGYYRLCLDAATGTIKLDGTKLPPQQLSFEINGIRYAPPVEPVAGSASACANITAYGGHGDGLDDNTAAFNAAKAQSNCIVFPAGTFRFTSPLIYDFTTNTKGVTILGQGQDVTILDFPNTVGTALTVNLMGLSNSFHLRDFTMATGTTNADTAIRVVQNRSEVLPRHASGYANSDVSRVTLRSSEGYWEQDANSVIHGWKTGIQTEGVSVVNFEEVTYYGPKPPSGMFAVAGGNGGTGIDVRAAGTGMWLPVLFNFDRVNINWAETGIVYGSFVQGFQVVSSNLTNCYIGLHVKPSEVDLSQLAIQTSQFNNTRNVLIESQVPQILITGNLFFVPSDQAAVEITKPIWQAQITGNAFSAQNAHTGIGILLTPDGVDPVPATISGNSFWELATAISLGANVDGALISGNTYRNNAKNILNASTSIYNSIVGGTPSFDWAGTQPTWSLVTGAADNGAGKTRVTVASTAGFFNGQVVIVGGMRGIVGIDDDKVISTTVNVIDATHLDLVNVGYAGSYVGGGMISSLPQ